VSHRVLIIGNSGAGKTWLGKALARTAQIPFYPMDTLFWQPGHFAQKHPKNEIEAACAQLIQESNWVIEGVFGWMADLCAPRATHLVWLDIPLAQCLENLTQRGPQFDEVLTEIHVREKALEDLKTWAAAYETREGSTARGYHLGLFEKFQGKKNRLTSRHEVASFCQLWKKLD
jgi:adenylate kinase family enzyme